MELPDLTNIRDAPFNTFKRIARLGLPRMNENCHIYNITCRADPNPIGAAAAAHPKEDEIRDWQRSRERSFSADPSRALVLVHILIRENELRQHPWLHWRVCWHRLNLVVHRDALVEAICAQSRPRGVIEEETNRTLLWKQWAPGIVRWCVGDEGKLTRITTTSGQRLVSLNTYGQLVVKDFNPHAVKRLRAALEASWQRIDLELQLSDSTCAEIVRTNVQRSEDLECLEIVFSTEDVLSKELPYVETISNLSSLGIEFDSVVLDEERIIGLTVCCHTLALYLRFRNSSALFLQQDPETNEVVKFDVISM